MFPVRPAAIRTSSQAEGERQTLALATGQFRGSSTSGVQRLDNELNVVVYYSEASETDFTAPLIGAVDSFVIDGELSIAVDVSDAGGVDDAGTGIDRVYVLVAENPGADTIDWIGVELAEDQTTAGRWVGSLRLSPGTRTCSCSSRPRTAPATSVSARTRARTSGRSRSTTRRPRLPTSRSRSTTSRAVTCR